MDHAAYCTLTRDEIDRYAATIDGADLSTPVPTCPGWTVLALTKHLGVVHRWAMQMLRDNATDRLDFHDVERNLPDDSSGYAAWIRDGGKALVDLLIERGPEAAVWTWGPGHNAGWWARRMALETLVHRADAAEALGAEFATTAELAVDGVDEFLENLPSAAASFAPNVLELTGRGESLHFHATDAPGEWMITLTAEGFMWGHGHGKGDVAVRGPAADLLLMAYGRTPADHEHLQRFGDTGLLDRWLAHSAI
jgi:uncharacterized protein (TIGR03083 family)